MTTFTLRVIQCGCRWILLNSSTLIYLVYLLAQVSTSDNTCVDNRI